MCTYKISVIIPIYNGEKFLQRSLESILSQTLKEIEIIIINDGSTDDSLSIIKNYMKNFTNIKLINQKNLGASLSRQNGIKIAKGEYIAFVDSDDFIEKEMYKEMYSHAKKTNADIVSCQFRKINSQNRTIFETANQYIENVENIFSNKSFSVLWNKIYKKELLNKENLMINKNIYYEDIGIVYKLYFLANKIETLPNVFYNWQEREGSITESFSKKHIKSMFFVLSSIKEFLKEKKVFSKYKNSYILKYSLSIDFLINRTRDYVNMFSQQKKLHKLIFNELKKSNIFNKKNLKLLKTINSTLYYKIDFYLFNEYIYTSLNNKNISRFLTSSEKEKTLFDKCSMIDKHKIIVQNKRKLYDLSIEELSRYNFSVKINKLFHSINLIKNSNKKIAIYGNGIIGNIIAQELEDKLIVIFDKNSSSKSTYAEVDTIENLHNYDLDILLISVFGREEEITKSIRKYNKTINIVEITF